MREWEQKLDECKPGKPWLSIPKQPQRQDSTQEQLSDLRLVAIHLGMYDALDHLQRALTRDE